MTEELTEASLERMLIEIKEKVGDQPIAYVPDTIVFRPDGSWYLTSRALQEQSR